MTEVTIPKPEEQATPEDLNIWYELIKQVAALAEQEMMLRKKIFATYFKDPKEGTNTAPLNAGWVLKATHKINRKVLIAELTTLTPELQAAGIVVEDVIKSKPELSVSAYKALDDAKRALFDRCLEIKPGSPALEIVLPKKAQK